MQTLSSLNVVLIELPLQRRGFQLREIRHGTKKKNCGYLLFRLMPDTPNLCRVQVQLGKVVLGRNNPEGCPHSSSVDPHFR